MYFSFPAVFNRKSKNSPAEDKRKFGEALNEDKRNPPVPIWSSDQNADGRISYYGRSVNN